MRRSTPLRRKAPLRTRSPLRRAAVTARRRATGPTLRTVELALERAGYSCEVCDGLIGDIRGWDWSAHHRAPRQAGGTRDAAYNAITNLLIVCGSGTTGCHGLIEAHRTTAYTAGWLVHRGQDPTTVPILRLDQGYTWWLLTTDGGYQETGWPS
jgi:hypothetical protein